uniref:Uncharacterized protein n=1 Tax=Chenopodium quinoa TaxID=63459 RepID=A0A803NEF3_CHEQI
MLKKNTLIPVHQKLILHVSLTGIISSSHQKWWMFLSTIHSEVPRGVVLGDYVIEYGDDDTADEFETSLVMKEIGDVMYPVSKFPDYRGDEFDDEFIHSRGPARILEEDAPASMTISCFLKFPKFMLEAEAEGNDEKPKQKRVL